MSDSEFHPLVIARTAVEQALAGLTDLQRLEVLDAIQDAAAEMGDNLEADLDDALGHG